MSDTDLPSQATTDEALRRALGALRELRTRLDKAERDTSEPIAVVGIGCRFPGGVDSAEQMFELVAEGRDVVGSIPADRWDSSYFDPDPTVPGKIYTDQGGFLSSPIDEYDPAFFGISGPEAEFVDPQLRLLLEVSWEAIEHAGLAADRLAGSRTGVFMGISTNDYGDVVLRSRPDGIIGPYDGTGSTFSMAAGRLSYFYGFRGPSLALDTACSSALVATALAVESLQRGACDLALGGGVNLMLDPKTTQAMCAIQALSAKGRCSTFSAEADGYIRSEGCGVIVLKRLSDAVAAGDDIKAVLRSAVVNHDGRSSGLTVPSGPAQQEAIRDALDRAGLRPTDIDYVEAHGTGTPLGDPIEVRALHNVYSEGRDPSDPLLLGSVKANMGHAEAAAGAAGLIKAIMLVNRGELAPHVLHGERTPHIDWDAMPIELVDGRRPWPERQRPRRAAVNAFGISGTNSHVIVEQPPARVPASEDGDAASVGPSPLILSARTPDALQDLAGRWADAVDGAPDSAADLAWTSQTARSRFASRLAVVTDDAGEMVDALRSHAADGGVAPIAVAGTANEPAIGYLYTGQGAQAPGMGRALFDAEPVFRGALETCNEVLADELPFGLLDLLFSDAADERLHDTRFTQPALVSLEWALAEQWAAWGVSPTAVAGHSIGEYAAAITAGVLDVEDGLRLAAARGRLMSALPAGGVMVSVLGPEDEVRTVLGDRPRTGIAAVNGPRATVVSGPADEVTPVVADLEAAGFTTRPLTVSHAFHSPLMEPMLEDFRRAVEQVTFSPPTLTFVSAVTGRPEHERLTEPDYWVDHVRATVRFGDALQAVSAESSALLELGPRPVLAAMAASVVPAATAIPSLHPDRDDPVQMRRAAAELWTTGVEPDWAAITAGAARTIDAPRYPFQRDRRWRDTPRRTAGGDRIHPLVHRRVRAPGLDDIVYESMLAGDDPAYLGDHRILGTAVMPAAAYVEMALAAGRDAFGDGQLALADMAVREMLVLPDAADVLVTTTISHTDSGAIRFRIDSREERAGDDVWHLHAEGDIRLSAAAPPEPVDIDELRSRGRPHVGNRYEELADAGFDYGPTFRVVSDVVHGPGWSVARLSGDPVGPSTEHVCHPALLDGCFQALSEAVADDELDTDDVVRVPTRLGRVDVFAPLTEAAWVITTAEVVEDRVEAEIVVCDDEGRALANIGGFHSLQVPADTVWRQLARAASGGTGVDHAHLLHETLWPELGELPRPAAAPKGPWLVAGSGPVASAIQAELADRGADVIAGLAALDWLDGDQHLAGAVHVVTPRPGDANVATADAVGSLHETVVSVVAGGDGKAGLAGPMWIVTAGAQPAADPVEPVDPAQRAVWGYVNALGAEMAAVPIAALDLDADVEPNVAMVVDEFLAGGSEDRLAHRDGRRYGARLSPLSVREHHELADESYELQLQERGTFSAIEIHPAEVPEPDADEVVLAVRASGLNFRDVLNVLGMYPGAPGVPGNECAGTVVAVGSAVTDVAVGDEVVAMADGSFRRYASVPRHLVFALPPEIDHAAAATLPITFLTAHLGLNRLGGLESGQTVLLHSGAGGVGLAALQLARRAGATVIATAGSPAKRRYLRRLGAAHVFDSRSLEFRDEVLAVTGGRGVDIALNSLADDFIPATLDTVASGGVFLEIGKRGVWSDEQMAAARPDVTYHLYDLGEEIRRDPEPLGQAMRQILADVADGDLEPLRRTTFPLDEVNAAFRYMANARHVGKVVVTQRPPEPTTGVHLVTGGHGALGLRTARELVERGASHIVLLSRSAPSDETVDAIDPLRAAGAEVISKAADVADRDALAEVLADVRATVGPIVGVYHAAGVLADGIVANLTAESFRTVFAPKVDGAWNLHVLTATDPVERFVLFSSVAAQLGSPGQTNYAAANAFLDGLAEHRHAMGLPAISLAWGPWSEIGMAATNGGPRSGAAGAIAPDVGADIITSSQGLVPAHVGVIPINWRRFARLGAPGTDRPFLERVVTVSDDGGSVVDLRSQLDGLDPGEKLAAVREAVRATVAEVLELPPASIDDHQAFPELGLDSLLGVELGNRLQRVLGNGSVAASAALEYPTVDALAAHLANDVLGLDGAAVGAGVGAVVPVDRGGDLPVSGAQNRLLFIERFEPGLSIYNIFMTARMAGDFDIDVAQTCFDEIVGRHEALRTDFEEVDGHYFQRIRPPRPADYVVEDWTDRSGPADAIMADAMERVAEFASQPFDLSSDLKLRTLVIRLADDDALVGSILHHTAGDGWSVARIVGEFLELYEARIEGRDHRLEEPSIHFADYSSWLQRRLESGELDEPIAYWREQLSGELPVLSFPVDRARPPVRTYDAGNYEFEIPRELEAEAKAWGAPSGATFFMTILASYAATLARYTGQDDIIIGTATANRLRPEIEPLVGFTTNTLPLRVRLDLEADFATLVEQVRRVVLDGAANQEAPFDQVVADVRPPRDLSRPPILQTVFLMTDVGFPTVDVAGLAAEFVRVPNPTVDYEIGVDILDLDSGHQGVVRYNTDLFDEATAAQFVDHWLHLLREAISGSSEPIAKLALAEGGDVDLSSAGGPTVAVDERRVHELFADQAARVPNKTALVADDRELTYAELDRAANRLANRLLARGVTPGSFVGVAADRSAEMVVSLLAVLKAGGAYLPLDPTYPPERLRFMIEDSQAALALDHRSALADVLGPTGIELVDVADPVDDAPAEGPPPTSDGELAYIIYTSGSTGRPKGVVVDHGNVRNFLEAMAVSPGLDEHDSLLAVTTLSFDISVLELLLPLTVGATTMLASPRTVADGPGLAALIDRLRPTVVQATPVTWGMLLDAGWAGHEGLKVLCGGEAMPRRLAVQLLERCDELWNMFGPTETTVWSTIHWIEPGAEAIPIGTPIANTVCAVVEPSGQLAPIGVPGELLIGGAGVARGYHRRPDLTGERFIDDPRRPGQRIYRTGDLARWRRDGTLEFLGRIDHQVKVRGHRIELGEIEAGLRSASSVHEAVVIADGGGAAARLVGYLVPTDPSEPPSIADLRAQLQESLPDYMIPSAFVVVDEFPLTPNRKIDRKALPPVDQGLLATSTEYVEPASATEAVLAGILQHVLDVDRAGVIDNFFELGGHSMQATTFLARVAGVFGHEVDLRDFFMEPTARGVAGALVKLDGDVERVERIAEVEMTLATMSDDEVDALLDAASDDPPAPGAP